MRTIDLESLRIFRTVVDEGGVVRAATKLNRVQSNVTTRIRQLEEHVGARLFRREGRNVRLSAEGQKLLGYADRLLRLADEAVSEMRTGKPRGAFRLGSLESTAGSRLPPLLSRYHAMLPEVVVELVTGTTGALIKRLANFKIEAAFVSEPFCAPHLRARPVFEEQLVLVTSRMVCELSRPADLRSSTLIAFADGCSYRKRVGEWLATENIAPNRILEFASYQAIIACVAARTGFAVVPRSVLSDLRSSKGIRQHMLPKKYALMLLNRSSGASSSALLSGARPMQDDLREAGLLEPDELARTFDRDKLRVLVLGAGRQPLILQRMRYFKDDMFGGMFDA
jgi:DNA-binding transcriptional LysR family regulator